MSLSHPDEKFARDSLGVPYTVALPTLVLDALIIIGCWNDVPARWTAISVCAFFAALNALVLPALVKHIDNHKLCRYREWANAAGLMAKTIVGHASVPTWGFLLAFASMTDKAGSFFSRITVLSLLVIQVGLSVYFGVPWFQIVVFSAVTIISMTISVSRTSVLLDAAADQRRQREQLEQLQQVATHQEKMSSLGMLAAGIAHEINNPMAFVTSNITQLEKDLPFWGKSEALLQEYKDEILPEIREGILRVNTIVDDLRRFARGDVEVRSTFDVNDVIRSAIRMTHGRVAPGVSVQVFSNDIPLQLGYPRQLSQVVVNLLVNAIQAVSRGGTIEIRSGCAGDYYWFSIADNGAGMDLETRQHIFEPFFTTKPIGEGTGLGLAVVHGIVEQLLGKIDLESQPGKGTIFRVTLPLRNDGADTGIYNMPKEYLNNKIPC